jgi:diadenosine tetraphosphate (Ap4A) HIT family hydrolase
MNTTCPFCNLDPSRIVDAGELYIVIRDRFPVSEGHTLIIPRRHVDSFFGVTTDEHVALVDALSAAKEQLDRELQPAGYNIGINDGVAAGQTVQHLHIHLIPRYEGDKTDPRGGVRWIFPNKGKYWSD